MRPWRLVIPLCLALVAAGGAAAQTTAPSDAVTSMLGRWEISNADRDRTCVVTFKLDMAGAAHALDLDKNCAAVFPNLKDVAAWTMGSAEALRLLDARGKVVLEFTEVENGLFESPHAGDQLYFLQTVAAAEGREHTPDQMFGEWAFARANGKPICPISLLDTAADTENFELRTKAPCDALITGFAPRAWHMDRGQFVLLSSKGENWRFEEGDAATWRRIPEGKQPLVLMKQ